MGVVQRYELDEQIAVGGMAEIHRARAISHDGASVPVVVKRIHPRHSEDPEYRQMFLNEARIAGVLDHPGIVRLLDVGEMDGRLFIAMELVDGQDLQNVLRAARAAKMEVTANAALYVTAQVLEALQHAHSRTLDGKPLKIVHRDITPQNVLVSKSGEVKVADFGLAKAAIRPGQTVAGVIKGNIRYMAPEQVSAKEVDARTDLYAAGMILHTLLSGRHPFEDEPLVRAITRCLAGDIPSPPARADGSQRLTDTVMKSVSTDPAFRYQTAERFLEAIHRLAGPGELAAGKADLAKLAVHASLPSALPPSPRSHSIAARLGPLIAESTGEETEGSGVFRSSAIAPVSAPAAASGPVALGGHSEIVTALAPFADGVRVASASGDRTVRIWNIAKRREERVLRGHEAGVTCCAVSPSGELVLSGGSDARARIWEAAGGSTVWIIDAPGPVTAVAFSPAGDLAIVGIEGGASTVWDYGRRKAVSQLEGHRDVVSAAAFTPDGRRVITGSFDGWVRVFDAMTGENVASFESDAETDSITALHVCSDGSLMATGGPSALVRIWDLASGAVIRTLIGHRAGVRGVAISADREHVLSASLDGTVRRWRIADSSELERRDAAGAVGALAAAPDLSWAVTGADRTVGLLTLA